MNSVLETKTDILILSLYMNMLIFFFFFSNDHSKTSFILGLQLANLHTHQIISKEAFQGEFHQRGPRPNLQMKNDLKLQKQVYFLDVDMIYIRHWGKNCCLLVSKL